MEARGWLWTALQYMLRSARNSPATHLVGGLITCGRRMTVRVGVRRFLLARTARRVMCKRVNKLLLLMAEFSPCGSVNVRSPEVPRPLSDWDTTARRMKTLLGRD